MLDGTGAICEIESSKQTKENPMAHTNRTPTHSTSTTILITRKSGDQFQLDVDIEGTVQTGGSNGYGSDEPFWVEAEVHTIYHTAGKKLSDLMFNAISPKEMRHIEECLADSRHDHD